MTLYDLIADLRRKHPTTAATETLDLVVGELGNTRDNLKQALSNVQAKALPPGGKQVLDELQTRAHEEGLDDLDYGPDPYGQPPSEPLDDATAGIGAALAISGLVTVALAVVAVVAALRLILSSNG